MKVPCGKDQPTYIDIFPKSLCSFPELEAPPELIDDVSNKATAAGLVKSPSAWVPGTAAWTCAWQAICSVWASKWTERAWLSRRARGVEEEELYMAVLLQQV
jgi:alpha-glucan,water dikinase